jgi:hypothetical protein
MNHKKQPFNTNRRHFSIYLFCFVLVYFADTVVNFGCGPEIDPYDYYTSFYHYNISAKSDYRSFYFTMGPILYDGAEPQNEADINSREWAVYLGRKVKSEDVKTAIYNLGAKTDSAILHKYLSEKSKLPDSLKHNSFLNALKTSKHTAARNYYLTLKAMEGISNLFFNDWDVNKRSGKIISAMHYAGLKALKNATVTDDVFLRLRYYYMAQRLLQYGNDDKKAAWVYEKYIASYSSCSYIKGAALSYRAGVEYRIGSRTKAALMFSQVFDKCPERRVQAYSDYRYIKAKTTDVIRIAKTNHQKAVVYAIDGFNSPYIGLHNLEMVYRYQPRSPLVGLLLTREINKLEEAYQSNKINKKLGYYRGQYDFLYNDSKTHTGQFFAYIPKLKTFCSKIASEHKYAEPQLGRLTMAYLDWMQNKTEAGLNTLVTVEDSQLSHRLYDQKQLIKIVLLAQKIKTLDTINQAELLPSLKWLRGKVNREIQSSIVPPESYYGGGGDYYYRKYAASARDFYQRILAPMYLKQRDTTMAALAMLEGTIKVKKPAEDYSLYEDAYQFKSFWQSYLHVSNLSKIALWQRKRPADEYTRFLSDGLKWIGPDFISDLQGTACLREYNYDRGIGYLERTNYKLLKKKNPYAVLDDPSFGNPFTAHLKDFPKRYGVRYSKLAFAKHMSMLKKRIKSDPKHASGYYFDMATGIYNTSMDGNAWSLISFEWNADDRDAPKRFYYYKDFIEVRTAEKLYLKASNLSTDKEFKARCTYMAAKCLHQRDNSRDEPYFGSLKKNYSKTNFYMIALHECSYLRDYIRTK